MAPADGNLRSAACFHCGEPALAPVYGTADGQRRVYCCPGCEGAARFIADSGLIDYYRLRDAPGARVGPDEDFSAWDRDDLQAEFAEDSAEGRCITLAVDGMHCAACAWLIDKALRRDAGVRDVRANAVASRVRVTWAPGQTRLSAVLGVMARLGYRPSLPGSPQREAARRLERRDLLLRLGVAGLGAMQAMMFSEALYLDTTGSMPMATRDGFRWLTALVSAPVVFYSGAPFLRGFWNEMKLRTPGMDTLIGSAVLLAWVGSVVETLRSGPQVWFDAAVMFVLFMLAARHIEGSARRSGQARLDALAGAQPALAWRESGEGLVQIPTRELQVGDVLRVGAGAALPTDGVLLDAAAAFDEALLTGESTPRPRQPGETVLAGSVVQEATARVQVSAVGPATVLSAMTKRVEEAQQQRPALADWAEALSRKVVLATVALAMLVGLVWTFIDASCAFPVALAVLVVTCPCALALAVPTALARANGVLAARGALVLGPQALQRLSEADTVAFDKTGTLTLGRPRVVHRELFAAAAGHDPDAIAAALEAALGHPLAHAFHAVTRTQASAVRSVVGEGVEGRVDGALWRIGQRRFALPDGGGPDAGTADDGRLWLAREGVAVARFTIDDPPRSDAVDTLATLRSNGMAIGILSGDAAERVAALAAALGVPEADARGRLLPDDKVAAVRALQAQGRRVLMVGDGLNDAAALAVADVSIAMANGAPLAQRQADVVVGGDALGRVGDVLAVARQTRRIIRQNLRWAIGYNLIVLPLAALGFMGPGLAALGMALSSLVVTANAMRIGSSL